VQHSFGIVNENVRQLAMRPTRSLAVLVIAAANQQTQGRVAAQQHVHAVGNRATMLVTLPYTNAQESS
jgi:hypothetical protein